ncbi:hypothetical protein C8R44DRAFT_866891 [Mycena epipterygia]|nr:hypothetical protein C8R44DRAFT_866891 [Mycena epipterygia]
MTLHTQIIEKLCPNEKTTAEAHRIFLAARAHTAVGSGFDLGGDRTGLEAVCAYLASRNLNNTDVTIAAAQMASCQPMTKFKNLRDHVARALTAHSPPQRKRLTYESLLQDHCPQLSLRAIPWMDTVQLLLFQRLEEHDYDDNTSEHEKMCAIFTYVSTVIEGQRPFHSQSFAQYQLDAANIIREDYHQTPSVIPNGISRPLRKAQVPPVLRILPSRDSHRQGLAAAQAHITTPAATSSLVTLQSIRESSGASSPTTGPSTSRQARPLLPSYCTPTTPLPRVTLLPISAPPLSLEPQLQRPRRFRPVFRDQQQWLMLDPRLGDLHKAAQDYHQCMIQRHGRPFQLS